LCYTENCLPGGQQQSVCLTGGPSLGTEVLGVG